eukprot:TRINITY_DN339_c1_g1_i1.p1 TRINITY_DN339_c1_g1~~TRINITY_DN339_c1_g1_i1.p1  ORF type:complete len:107 (-),score=29.15 TRINITY_DN339_c1_g1_i1:246-566(-)
MSLVVSTVLFLAFLVRQTAGEEAKALRGAEMMQKSSSEAAQGAGAFDAKALGNATVVFLEKEERWIDLKTSPEVFETCTFRCCGASISFDCGNCNTGCCCQQGWWR